MNSSNRRLYPADTSKPKLWGAKICPFVAKCVIALQELEVPYEDIEVDLINKPAELFKINPKGQVPVLEDQGKVFTESYNIVEYIDEMWARSDGKTLFPKAPTDRYVARTWCQYINSNLVKHFYGILMRPTTEEQDEAKKMLSEVLQVLNDAMKDISDGPFFMGAEFGVVDIILAPHVERFPGLEIKGYQMPKTEQMKRFKSWWEAVQQHPSFKRNRISASYVVEYYQNHLQNKTKK